jgi:hypothetical protein
VKLKKDVAPSLLSSEKVYDEITQYKGIIFGFHASKQKFFGFGVTYN